MMNLQNSCVDLMQKNTRILFTSMDVEIYILYKQKLILKKQEIIY